MKNGVPMTSKQPKTIPNPPGYGEKVANTQTQQTRGGGAATKGTKSSSKLG